MRESEPIDDVVREPAEQVATDLTTPIPLGEAPSPTLSTAQLKELQRWELIRKRAANASKRLLAARPVWAKTHNPTELMDLVDSMVKNRRTHGVYLTAYEIQALKSWHGLVRMRLKLAAIAQEKATSETSESGSTDIASAPGDGPSI